MYTIAMNHRTGLFPTFDSYAAALRACPPPTRGKRFSVVRER